MMKNVKLDIAKTGIEISADIEAKAQAANALLHSGNGAGNDFLGWVHLPSSISENEIDAIRKEAAKLRSKANVVVCIGIGGSYLGAKAVLEAMSNPFKLLHKEQKDPTVIFAGQNISEDYTAELLAALKEHSIAAIVISKSGTTTEPAIAFRLIKAEIEKRYGKKEAAERIVAITDKARGALKTLAAQEGYPTFVIPDDVGGRFSVLTPVGLLPLAVAGVDIAALVRGAQEMEKATAEGVAFKENPAAVYAAVRNILYDGGKKIEILGSYEPKLQYINEWWKQLYGESEGKQGKGIFPASVTLTADLHSMGQYIQDGERTLFETIISVAKPAAEVLHRGRRGEPRRAELPGREAHFGGQPHGRAGRSAGPRGRRRAEHPHRDSRNLGERDRRPAVLLREGLRHQRLYAGRESLRPAGRRGLQEEHVRPAGQTRLRGGFESHQGPFVKRVSGAWAAAFPSRSCASIRLVSKADTEKANPRRGLAFFIYWPRRLLTAHPSAFLGENLCFALFLHVEQFFPETAVRSRDALSGF